MCWTRVDSLSADYLLDLAFGGGERSHLPLQDA